MKTLIIAEAGVNHNGDISRARELVAGLIERPELAAGPWARAAACAPIAAKPTCASRTSSLCTDPRGVVHPATAKAATKVIWVRERYDTRVSMTESERARPGAITRLSAGRSKCAR